MIRTDLAGAIARAIAELQESGALPAFEVPEIELARPARPEHGDWASQVALAAAKRAGMKPRDIAEAIASKLRDLPDLASVEVAGPGFLNLRIALSRLTGIVREVEEAGESWGRTPVTDGPTERIQVEFVSANPTGPLHVGHGRWAAIGDVLATLLEATGQSVRREFYINDFGEQMEIFGRSLAVRYLQALGREAELPENAYRGVYLVELANDIVAEAADRYAGLAADALASAMRAIGRERMLAHQREVLERMSVRFDEWFSETGLHERGEIDQAIETLKRHGHVYEADGATWLRTTDFGDDKDRVIVREDGRPTYFASDVAYYLAKRSRGFERIIYLWGADHHGYVGRVRAAVRCLGDDPETVEFLIGQLVNLLRGGEPVRMSKRTGELVTLEELLDEVGADAVRYTFLRQGMETPVDFDIEVVVRRSQDNPVYYVQYAHARICSIISYASEQGVTPIPVGEARLEELRHPSELDLIRKIGDLPDVVTVAAKLRAPHRLTRYAEDLAALFHAFYRDCRVVTEDAALTQARLHLCKSAQIALRDVLALLGVSAPEKM